MRALQPLWSIGYRWLFASLLYSLLAEGMFVVALVWQVVELGGGPGELALASATMAVGMVGAALVGGVLADRLSQQHILIGVAVAQYMALAGLAVLSLSGLLTLGELAVGALLIGIANGFYFPAYSALVPALIPDEQLLAANGLEGMTRPALAQAVGPAVASALVAVASPGAALAVAAVAAGLAGVFVAGMPVTPHRRTFDDGHRTLDPRQLGRDMADGFRYLTRVPWLLATSLFGALMVLLIIGPLEVLVPFAVRDQVGGGPREHAMVLAAFGVGAVVGPAIVASRPLPRRYLTVMVLAWGIGCLPMVVFGLVDQLWVMIAAAFVTGLLFDGAQVIWGTLLQRRVPPELLGRVSSLDFFVTLAFMPVSMAVAGTVAHLVGLRTVFLVAGLVPVVLAVITVVVARMPRDELAHPLDLPGTPPWREKPVVPTGDPRHVLDGHGGTAGTWEIPESPDRSVPMTTPTGPTREGERPDQRGWYVLRIVDVDPRGAERVVVEYQMHDPGPVPWFGRTGNAARGSGPQTPRVTA